MQTTIMMGNAVALPTDGTLPTEFIIFAAGDNIASHEPYIVTYDPSQKQTLIDAYNTLDGRDMLNIDVDHMTFEVGPPESHASLAWFKLSFEDDGIWARDVQWTGIGTTLMNDRAFRFISPAFECADGALVRIINVAVTNVPATVNPEPLLNSMRKAIESRPTFTQPSYLGNKMTDTKKRAKAAPPPAPADDEEAPPSSQAPASSDAAPMSPEEMMKAISDLQAENAALKKQLADASTQAAQAIAAKSDMEKETILNSLTSEGLLAPFMKRSLSKLSLSDVKEADKDLRSGAKPQSKVRELPTTVQKAVNPRQPYALTNVDVSRKKS